MVIIKTTKKLIYCYHDYTFMVFNRNSVISGAKMIGAAWAAGKTNRSSHHVPVEIIYKDTCYHSILVMTLMEKKNQQYCMCRQ